MFPGFLLAALMFLALHPWRVRRLAEKGCKPTQSPPQQIAAEHAQGVQYNVINYSIRPLERRKGYAKEQLRLTLEKCRAMT